MLLPGKGLPGLVGADLPEAVFLGLREVPSGVFKDFKEQQIATGKPTLFLEVPLS